MKNYSQTIDDIKEAQSKYENTGNTASITENISLNSLQNEFSNNSPPQFMSADALGSNDRDMLESNEMAASGPLSAESKLNQDNQLVKNLNNDKLSQRRFYAAQRGMSTSQNKNMVEKITGDKKTISGVSLKQQAIDFMVGVMDECTHLGNFSTPVDTDLIIIVAAKKDAFVPRDKVLSLESLWPGSEVRYIAGGHVKAFIWHQEVFR